MPRPRDLDRFDLSLVIGFTVCVVIGVLTVLLPELSAHDEKPAPAARSPAPAQARK